MLTLQALVERFENAHHVIKALRLGSRLRNAGKTSIVVGDSFTVVTLPVPMFDDDNFPVASIVDDGALAVSMAGGQKLVVGAVTATSFRVSLVDAVGAAIVVPAGGPIYVNWSVQGGRVQ